MIVIRFYQLERCTAREGNVSFGKSTAYIALLSTSVGPFLDLKLSKTNGIVSSKIYDKRDDFNFEIVNFPFLDGDVPRSPSYGVYISQLIRFARVCSNVDDFNNRNFNC